MSIHPNQIMVALDTSDVQVVRNLVTSLKGISCYFKVGMQLFYAAGPAIVKELKEMGYRVFLDLKMHDIPNTVKGGAYSITQLGVDMFNVHASGGVAMMQAAKEGAIQAQKENTSLSVPLIVGVTQLTSTTPQVLKTEVGIDKPMVNIVEHYARMTQQAGLDGVVASAQEVEHIKLACGSDFLTVTPGIRVNQNSKDDQARIMTPLEALKKGSDFLVIGRPITQATNPRTALENIMEGVIC